MKNSIQLFLIFIFSTITYSQINTISGTILDSLKNPIKYANVGVLNKPIGTVTNDKGEFFIFIQKYNNRNGYFKNFLFRV